MEYMTSAECAEKWNVSQRWVAIYCKEGRIEGAVQKGRMWFIPAGTEKPQNLQRIKSITILRLKKIKKCNNYIIFNYLRIQ